MEITFIGIIQIVIGSTILLAGSVRSALVFLIVSALFDGSAAMSLPALGGSSIPPVQFALLFTSLRILAPKGGYIGLLPAAVSANKWIVLFAIYGIAAAYLGPRVFGGAINVFPMRAEAVMGAFDTIPLRPTSQNITGAAYLLGAMLLAISAYIFCRIPTGGNALIAGILLASLIHIATGVLDVVTRGTPSEFLLEMFRNGNYALLDHSVSGFIRIRGLLPEASSYAAIGFTLFVATAELWYRSIRSRVTGMAAMALAAMLVLSTASTAYLALAAYVLFFALRAVAFPASVPRGKLRQAGMACLGILVALCVSILVFPGFARAAFDVVIAMTLDKSGSFSGQQRLFWAMQGWDHFLASYGLGIGPGSFRSSSIFTAILGSMGIVGMATFALYLATVFGASRRSTWTTGHSEVQSLGGALGVAAVMGLAPAAVSAAQPAPGALFCILAGAAIALHTSPATVGRRTQMTKEYDEWEPGENERPAAVA